LTKNYVNIIANKYLAFYFILEHYRLILQLHTIHDVFLTTFVEKITNNLTYENSFVKSS